MDSTTRTLEDYNIPVVGIIQIEENNISITVSLPTGHDKIYSIAKGNTIRDLKERISVGFHQPFFIFSYLYSLHLKTFVSFIMGIKSRIACL